MAAPTPSKLDGQQVLQGSFDEANGRLRVDAEITSSIIAPPGLEVSISSTDDNIAIGNANNGYQLLINADGSINTKDTISSATSSITIGNSNNGNQLQVNPDGSINVDVINATSKSVYSLFNSISSVASGILTTIISYTVPSGQTNYLSHIEATGDNIAQFEVNINGVLSARQRTYFGGSLNTDFKFTVDTLLGYELTAGTNVTVNVIHSRPYVGNFEARIVYAQ